MGGIRRTLRMEVFQIYMRVKVSGARWVSGSEIYMGKPLIRHTVRCYASFCAGFSASFLVW